MIILSRNCDRHQENLAKMRQHFLAAMDRGRQCVTSGHLEKAKVLINQQNIF